MTRKLVTLAALLALPAVAPAQDMPISQILIDGEGWKKVENPGVRFASAPVLTQSADGKTTFRWAYSSGRFVEARPTNAPEDAPFIPYCPLRVKRGEKAIFVSGLTTDRDGRIYAATDIGVQVFDPTGRPCGVLTPAAPGEPERIAFEGDRLTLWIGDTKYARKLNTTGAK